MGLVSPMEVDVLQEQAPADVTLKELQAEIRENKRHHTAKIEYLENEMHAVRRMVQEIYNCLVKGNSSQGTPSFGGGQAVSPPCSWD